MAAHKIPIPERLSKWSMASPSGCCIWVGSFFKTGYGRLTVEKKSTLAHRLAWEIAYGAIPEGIFVLHKCDVRSCVNPEHLFLGTQLDNMRDKVEKGRQARGSLNGQAKLDDNKALAIRLHPGKHRDIANIFGVGKTTVTQIKNGLTWRHVCQS